MKEGATMSYEIVLTTAEDIVAVVDAVFAKPDECKKDFICQFTDLTESRAENALHMAEQLSLIKYDALSSNYYRSSYLARLMVSSRSDEQKASIMRLVLEQYEPYVTFKSRFVFTDSADSASKQVRILYTMRSQYKDIKNTIISMATYSKSIIDDGANIYRLNQDITSYINVLEGALKHKSSDENILINQFGNTIYDMLDKENVFKPLSDAYSKLQNISIDTRSIIVYAGNAFESFLVQIAVLRGISLEGKNGIIAKANSLTLSKKHKGMIEFIGQVRNAADHGADSSEGGNTWEISEETARVYPFLVTNLIKVILQRDAGNLFV
jgi:hypothetical protein